MGLSSMFSTQASPIAVDFGTAAVKLLQVSTTGRAAITAIAELPIPDAARLDAARRFAFIAERLPALLSGGKFKGKRAIIAIPASQTFTQHMQLPHVEKTTPEDLIKGQLNAQTGCLPQSVVVRWIKAADVHRDGQSLDEVICFAMSRDTVLRYVELLRKMKLNVVGVHTAAIAMVRAFDHLESGSAEKATTLFVDLGWGGTLVAVAHGSDVRFARSIQIGGRHFDQQIASGLHCQIDQARRHRLALDEPRAPRAPRQTGAGAALLAVAAAAEATAHQRSGGSTGSAVAERTAPAADAPPTSIGGVDLAELLDTMADELSMCLRYHQGLFPQRPIDRAILLGGEARQGWLCKHLARTLRVPVQLGDPLVRLERGAGLRTPNLDLDEPQPGWAVPCGLCTAPTDL